MYTISLSYGDPSSDGHGMSSTDYYSSSHSTKEIYSAMTKAQKVYNFDWDSICAEYGESDLSDETYVLFKSIGIDVDKFVEDDDHHVTNFTGLYLAVASTQLPDLETSYMKITNDDLDIGGYGLFEN